MIKPPNLTKPIKYLNNHFYLIIYNLLLYPIYSIFLTPISSFLYFNYINGNSSFDTEKIKIEDSVVNSRKLFGS